MDLKAASVIAYCQSKGYPVPEPEYRFHPTRKYRADLAWTEVRCLLEFEGSIFGTGKRCPVCNLKRGGGHTSITGILRDIERSTEAALLGWRIIRCTVQDVESGAVYSLIDRLFAKLTAEPAAESEVIRWDARSTSARNAASRL